MVERSMRQPFGRSQRSKGCRMKHTIQFGVLLAICIWLLYQVKHSHDKRRELEERSLGTSKNMGNGINDAFILGRKGLPHLEDVGLSTEVRDELEDREEAEEEEDENDIKQEDPEDEGGAGDDDIDDQDQDLGDEEDHGEELDGDEDKEVREGEKEFMDEEEDKEAQEAREENYRRDDVAGSVHRGTQTMELDGNGDTEDHREDARKEVIEAANREADGSMVNNESNIGSLERGNGMVDESIAKNELSNGAADGARGRADGFTTNNEPSIGSYKRAHAIVDEKAYNHESSSVFTERTNGTVEAKTAIIQSGISIPENAQSNVSSTALLSTNAGMLDNNVSTVTSDLHKKSPEISYEIEQQPLNNSTSLDSSNQNDMHVISKVSGTDHHMEVLNNSAVIGMVTNDPQQNADATLDSSDGQNSKTESRSFAEDKSNLEVMTMPEKVNANGKQENAKENSSAFTNEADSSAAHRDVDNSVNPVTEEEREARTDLSTLPDTQNEVKSITDEAIE